MGAMGIAGFALGSVLGRIASVLMLGRAVLQIVRVPTVAVAIIAFSAATTAFIQFLNASPDSTLWIRVLVAVTACAVGIGGLSVTGRPPTDSPGDR